jgi:hypothetical protein
MSGCEVAERAPFRCPTLAEVRASMLALLPRGRAWQSNEGGPQSGVAIGFDPGGYDNDGFATQYRKAAVLYQFWTAVAEVFSYVNDRLCALRLEFWCATQTETRDLWLAEYGLPDDCDPFPDLCTKVAALGGTRCEYYAEIAARAGWSITCVDRISSCGTYVGGRASKAGRARPGRRKGAVLTIIVDLANSPKFTGPAHATAKAGRMKPGRRLSCGPDIGPLECLMARAVHAEIQVTYEVK